MLFPRQQRWERRRRAKMIVGVVFAALIFAGCVGVIIYRQGLDHH